jgi:hypothetical protein
MIVVVTRERVETDLVTWTAAATCNPEGQPQMETERPSGKKRKKRGGGFNYTLWLLKLEALHDVT